MAKQLVQYKGKFITTVKTLLSFIQPGPWKFVMKISAQSVELVWGYLVRNKQTDMILFYIRGKNAYILPNIVNNKTKLEQLGYSPSQYNHLSEERAPKIESLVACIGL